MRTRMAGGPVSRQQSERLSPPGPDFVTRLSPFVRSLDVI
jgi:hypothetical protein